MGQKEITSNDPTRPLLRTIQEAGVDWMTDCGGKGRCTTCKAIVVSGGEHLTGTTPAELKYRGIGALHSNERLMCQVRATGDVTLRVPEEFKLRHVKYS
ncbi:MAG TPA: 2Fe-2S iron-sulfur cluster-binding protein [Cyclobacteriaceae bacterium]|nr:2Fe-2S iron-sulfur cluster-binding protein [Cyclobacteriaceae bacterium]